MRDVPLLRAVTPWEAGNSIQQYAQQHGFSIVKTYVDAGRSGVTLKRRGALTALLADVLRRRACYRAILVYDVSRWGRFQDADESAHYEFLCKKAGIPVHYCAELFPNDGTLTSSIFKALKRTMAAEYSRELGVKPESPFWFKNGTDNTPIPLFADSVKQFSYGPPPNAPRSEPAPPKLPDIPPLLQHLSLL